jgi:hypothetical protein
MSHENDPTWHRQQYDQAFDTAGLARLDAEDWREHHKIIGKKFGEFSMEVFEAEGLLLQAEQASETAAIELKAAVDDAWRDKGRRQAAYTDAAVADLTAAGKQTSFGQTTTERQMKEFENGVRKELNQLPIVAEFYLGLEFGGEPKYSKEDRRAARQVFPKQEVDDAIYDRASAQSTAELFNVIRTLCKDPKWGVETHNGNKLSRQLSALDEESKTGEVIEIFYFPRGSYEGGSAQGSRKTVVELKKFSYEETMVDDAKLVYAGSDVIRREDLVIGADGVAYIRRRTTKETGKTSFTYSGYRLASDDEVQAGIDMITGIVASRRPAESYLFVKADLPAHAEDVA